MKPAISTFAAVLLAIPLVVLGGNYFLRLFEVPPGDGGEGERLLALMRDGGLMAAIAFSHVVAGALLLVGRTRFLGGMLQLPMSLGIVSFHATMLPQGLATAVPMLLLNLAVVADPPRLRALVQSPPTRPRVAGKPLP